MQNHFYSSQVVCFFTTILYEILYKKLVRPYIDVFSFYSLGSSGNSIKTGSDAIVNQFIQSPASIHCTLVICYDMFRSYAQLLNSCTMKNPLELLICDEGKMHHISFTNITIPIFYFIVFYCI